MRRSSANESGVQRGRLLERSPDTAAAFQVRFTSCTDGRRIRYDERSQSSGRWKRSLHWQTALSPAPLHWVVMLHATSVTKTETFRTCDDCGKRLEHNRHCIGCGKDVCNQCGNWWYNNPFTGNDYGDYPELVCERCKNLADLVAPEAISIQAKADAQIETIIQGWLDKCKSA